MCAIIGYCGKKETFNKEFFEKLVKNAGDRGRDGHRVEHYELCGGYIAALGAWRARPVHEVEHAKIQPYDGVVHNGTIANAEQLGLKEGQVDSEILPTVLNRKTLTHFARSLKHVIGSYAIAAKTPCTVLVATNYKPIHYYAPNETDVYFASMERHFHNLLPFGVRPAIVEPYTAMDLRKKGTIILPRSEGEPPTALVTASAGLDSTVALADIIAKKYQPGLLYFRYGCRAEAQELKAVEAIAEWYNIPFHTLKINYDQMKGTSGIMTRDRAISGKEGMEFAHEWVPARNLVLLANATAFAEANGYHYITLGNNIDEGGSFPDNEEQFTYLFDKVLDYAVKANYKLRLITPLGHLTKIEIVKRGIALKAPFHLTHSCYQGNKAACGKCASCLFRLKAFQANKRIDPIKYKSLPTTDFWKDCKPL